MSKRNINNLKSIGPYALLLRYEHLKFDLDRVQINMLKLKKRSEIAK